MTTQTYRKGLSFKQAVSAVSRSRFLLGMDKFRADGVVPDVIEKEPPTILKLKYGGSVDVVPGMTLTPTQVKDPPAVEYEAESGAFYTLIMNDPDAPSRKNPKFGEWHHWLVVNIPGSNLASGEAMSEYIGSGPPKDTGLHRYVFLLYKQPDGKKDFGLKKLTNRSTDDRACHKVQKFISDHKLTELVAGNFYQAEYDDYVPKLYEQLKG